MYKIYFIYIYIYCIFFACCVHLALSSLLQVDPDELSPNMRLGLPDESKYDLDRLMYTPTNETDKKPEKKRKNGFIKGIKGKGSRKDLLLTDRMEVGLLIYTSLFAYPLFI